MIWWLLLIGSILVFLVVEIFVLPKYLLESKYSIGQTSDRGIKKYKTSKDGLYMVYEPNLLVRKFISQYLIASIGNKKILKCQVKNGINYLNYDVVLFNANGKVFKVLAVQNYIEEGIYTDEIELPSETAYVTLVLNEANSKKFPKITCAKISAAKIVLYCVITCVLAMATAFCMNLSLSYIFGGVFRESYASSVMENVLVLGVALVAAVIGAITMSAVLIVKNKKK